MQKIALSTRTAARALKALKEIFQGARSAVVVLHNQPDPDALASGFALKTLLESKHGIATTLCYGGMISRAENTKMVKLLGIPVVPFDQIDLGRFDRIAMVDTQPGRGNNPLPAALPCHLVIDHHLGNENKSDGVLIYSRQVGATATLLAELLTAAEAEIKPATATAIIYAIRTETQELQREAHPRDLKVYLTLFPLCSLRKLGAIAYPKLPNAYFTGLAIALNRAMTFGRIIFVPLGTVPQPEIVAEIADFFLRHRRITWVLVMGKFHDHVYFSLRTTHADGRAYRLLQEIIQDRSNAGGHETYAGGRLPMNDRPWAEWVAGTAAAFTRLLGYADVQWRPLVGSRRHVL